MEKLRKLLRAKEITQAQVAKDTNTAIATVNGYLTGKYSPRLDWIEMVCELYQFDVKDIVCAS